jgi:integrase
MSTRKQHNRAPNSGSISINRSGSVRAQITLPGGKRVTKSFSTKREADTWLREMRSQIDVGLTTANHDILFSDFIRDWLVRKKAQLRPKTLADYTHYCNEMIAPHLGMLKLREIKLHAVNNFYVALADEGRPVYVIRYTHRVLHSMFADAVRLGFIAANPAQYTDTPVVDDAQDKMQIFSSAEYQLFIEACSHALYGVLYRLAIKTGMRQGELLGLTWKNIDLDRGEIRVIQQLSRFGQGGQRLTFAPLKTKYSRRTIKIWGDLVELLRAYFLAQQKYKQLMGTRWQENDLVFTSSLGTPLDQRNMQRDFDKLLQTAGLSKIRFHDLRHNAASLMLGAKVSVVTVSRYLGHSSPRVTLEIYAHLIPGGFDEVAQAMSAISVSVEAG